MRARAPSTPTTAPAMTGLLSLLLSLESSSVDDEDEGEEDEGEEADLEVEAAAPPGTVHGAGVEEVGEGAIGEGCEEAMEAREAEES